MTLIQIKPLKKGAAFLSYSTLIFASVILPLSVLVLFLDRSAEYKNLILCIVSVLFVSWGRSVLAALVFLSFFADYLLALAVSGTSAKKAKPAAAFFLLADFVWNASLLTVLARSAAAGAGTQPLIQKALIPVGTAFFALRNFTYVYDVYKGNCHAEKNPFVLMTYCCGYPFLLAGPVTRYADYEPQLRKRPMDAGLLSSGLERFAKGLAKTVICVPVLSALAKTGLDPKEPALSGAWIGMAAFFGAGYLTFAGLSDMGTGIARMNGFSADVNYAPLSAKHMMSSIVKSCNKSMAELAADMRGRKNKARAAFLTLPLAMLGAAFFLPSAKALAIGAAAGLLLAFECLIGTKKLEKIPSVIKIPAVFLISMVIFSPFAFDDMSEWLSWLGRLVGAGDSYILSKPMKEILLGNGVLLLITLFSISPFGVGLSAKLDAVTPAEPKKYAAVRRLRTLFSAALLIVSFILAASRTMN